MSLGYSGGYEALRHGAAWLDLSARGRIVARGRDRARLLHAITSNEVKKMTPGTGCYAFLLNPRGRIQADLCLFCHADHFLIDTEPEVREKVHAHIKRYIIADQVELEEVTALTAAIGLEGPGVEAILAQLGAPVPALVPGAGYSHAAWGDATVAAVTVTGQPGVRIFCPAEQVADLVRRLETAGAVAASVEDARFVRIENGKPRYGEDIRETSLPQETQQMHAVSFSKGCYVGQEIVERIRAQGRVNKKLMRVVLEGGEVPAAGSKTAVDGAEAEVTSAIVSPASGEVVALAYVRQR
jgi:folate-binding protein YgfZ